jgi:hypothetical protein
VRRLRSSRRSGGGVLKDQRFGLGIAQKEIKFACGRAPIHRCDDETGKLAGPMQRSRFPAVLQRGDEVIAGLKAERIKSSDRRRNARVPLRISQAQLAINNR